MSTLFSVPVHINREQLAKKLHIRPNGALAEEFEELLQEVEAIANPKVFYRTAFVDHIEEDRVTIDQTTFRSSVLARNLNGIGRVFAYVATCGTEVDQMPTDPKDFVKTTWLHYIKLELLKPCIPFLKQHLKETLGLEKLSIMNPGSAEVSIWPIEQQTDLFSLIGDVETRVGVHLTESFLMAPDISVSGILFPADVAYQNCQLCQRKGCPNRSAPFNAELWESIHAQ